MEERRYSSIDMHMHTKGGSDGEDDPLHLLMRVLNRYTKNGFDFNESESGKLISITDHNSISGYKILEEQINEILSQLEKVKQEKNFSPENQAMTKYILRLISEIKIVPGCEIKTFFEGCNYVEILGYGVDLEKLEGKLKELHTGLRDSSEVLCEGFKKVKQRNGLTIDEFLIDNRNDYAKLFIHEIAKHLENPENAAFYGKLQGETEEEKTEDFRTNYLTNPQSTFYVDLSNRETRKSDAIEMVMRRKKAQGLEYDIEVMKHAGASAGQFYIELLKHPENAHLIDPRIDSEKKFLYLGLYNEKSPFFVDLTGTKPSPESVVKAIHECGGRALIAHWGRYNLSNPDVFDWQTEQGRKNLEELISMCDGAECAYPDNPEDLRALIYELCEKMGKVVSVGGDHHAVWGKEGKQYELLSQELSQDSEELKEKYGWVLELISEGKEFFHQMEEKYHLKARLEQLLKQKEAETTEVTAGNNVPASKKTLEDDEPEL